MIPAGGKIHFIAIGGSVMHNLAIALKEAGYAVSGSDDEIFEPSRSRLAEAGLLPESQGWRPEKIDSSINLVILGMHAKIDNPELLKAQELQIPILSFPDFILQHAANKHRIVIAGSHGKTTITAMIIHVLDFYKKPFDYVIGARVGKMKKTVRLSNAPIIIIEGDEYLSSALDPTPKFIRYKHHIGVISGISWDHANVYPTEDDYVKQFDVFADATPKAGALIYCEEDAMATVIGGKERTDVISVPYRSHPYQEENGKAYLIDDNKINVPLKIFGKHNMQNISAAKEVLKKIGITNEQFYHAIQHFEGASGRLQKVIENNSFTFFKDYAHAPSKVKATCHAVKEMYPDRELVACLELHTFSSLNKNFIKQYEGTLRFASKALVYFNPEKVKQKGFDHLTEEDIKKAFGDNAIMVFESSDNLLEYLQAQNWQHKNLLMMSSGTFNGIDMQALAQNLKP
ncbi:MAG TPA: Mur ligase family protein [Cyclobacteriaceae bacterium]|nr:Mur ligase family protein [Cyclobacteriaceae bacterium]